MGITVDSKEPKKSKPFVFKTWMIGNLRRLSFRWPPKWEVKKKAKLSRGLYMCNVCHNPTRNKDIFIDHLEPIIDPATGFIDWNTYIQRMFIEESGLQAICRTCHDLKTKGERQLASKRRQNKKKLTKPS